LDWIAKTIRLAEVLVRVLNGLQETAYVIGAAADGKSVGGHFKPSSELRGHIRFAVVCNDLHTTAWA
jgi:hypothetical protein